MRRNMAFIAVLMALVVGVVMAVFGGDKPELAIGAAMLVLGAWAAWGKDLISPPKEDADPPAFVPAETHSATVEQLAGLVRDTLAKLPNAVTGAEPPG